MIQQCDGGGHTRIVTAGQHEIVEQWGTRFKSPHDKNIRDSRAVKSPCPAILKAIYFSL